MQSPVQIGPEAQHHGEGTVEPGQHVPLLPAQRSCHTLMQSRCKEEESECEETHVHEQRSGDRRYHQYVQLQSQVRVWCNTEMEEAELLSCSSTSWRLGFKHS